MSVQDMARALERRDDGIASSAQHAEEVQPGWQEMAYGWLEWWVDSVAAYPSFTMEEFRTHPSIIEMDQPAELRAYGALTQRAIRHGLIEKVGYAPAVSSNGSPKALYRRKGP